jgi:hypothetical protein
MGDRAKRPVSNGEAVSISANLSLLSAGRLRLVRRISTGYEYTVSLPQHGPGSTSAISPPADSKSLARCTSGGCAWPSAVIAVEDIEPRGAPERLGVAMVDLRLYRGRARPTARP